MKFLEMVIQQDLPQKTPIQIVQASTGAPGLLKQKGVFALKLLSPFAANNLTYTYAVVPVDKLGNMGAKVETTQIRIAYDTLFITTDLSP